MENQVVDTVSHTMIATIINELQISANLGVVATHMKRSPTIMSRACSAQILPM